jgi:hypothetical protein
VNRAFKGALVGAISGAVGTGAMDLVWYRRFRKGGGDQGFYAWETGKSIKGWDEVSDPGKVRELIARKAVGHVPDDHWARSATNFVHWAAGVMWGAQFGLLTSVSPRHRQQLDLVVGPTAWLSSYTILPLLKVYKPIWQYDLRTLEKDLSAHLTFGTVTALTFALLSRSQTG